MKRSGVRSFELTEPGFSSFHLQVGSATQFCIRTSLRGGSACRGLASASRWSSLRRYRYGPGVFKMDWALSEPIPWRAKECLQAATVHVGGTFEEIAESERAAVDGRPPEKPFVLLLIPAVPVWKAHCLGLLSCAEWVGIFCAAAD